MSGKIDRILDFLGARLVYVPGPQLLKVRLCPDDFRTVSAVQLLDALTRVTGDLAERINRIRQHARQNLHPVVSSSWLVGPLITPATNYRPYFLGPIELRNPKLTEVVRYAIKPW